MRLLLLSLGMLFVASLAGMLAVRGQADVWPPPGMPTLPGGLWLSTALILTSSVAVQGALRAIRRGDARQLQLGLWLTLLLGLAFLASQTVAWFALAAQSFTPRLNLYAFTFYLLTVLHALHVVGGLIPLTLVAARANRQAYSQSRHNGVEYVATYWHFLDAVWIVLFIALVVL